MDGWMMCCLMGVKKKLVWFGQFEKNLDDQSLGQKKDVLLFSVESRHV